MSSTGHSDKDFFGRGYTHYDKNGKKVGRSEPSMLGGYTDYDAKGRKIGKSTPRALGGYNHYDAKGKKTGYTSPGVFGGYDHYDSKGRKTGHSDHYVFGSGYEHKTADACYIATCVYRSYDCPEVWTLRRFRDQRLKKSVFGRMFIRVYYAVSPTLVRWFGQKTWFRTFWKKNLDRMVSRLRNDGVSDAPYCDR